ncbi:MAG: helix-turn-helix transcriptional regulator [Lachnospirales bacterium]
MAKSPNQKLKLLYLMKILLEQTDENHRITMTEIIENLASYNISAERKSLYNDIESLRLYGLDIIGIQEGRTYFYYVGSRRFELAELKLLVDSVQSAKFITAKKSSELIKKLEGLASRYEASKLHRQVFVAGRVKTMNESIYYNVDRIQTVIGENSKITFQYFQWNVEKKMELRHDGAVYKVSPWALSWNDGNYYLIAYDGEKGIIKHFRVDKMLHIELNGEKREGEQVFQSFDMAAYARKMFGMYGGKEERVRLECENSFAGVIIDRFGKDVTLNRLDDTHFFVNVEAAVSRQFLSWVIGLGEGVKITGPESVVARMKDEIRRLMRQYQK